VARACRRGRGVPLAPRDARRRHDAKAAAVSGVDTIINGHNATTTTPAFAKALCALGHPSRFATPLGVTNRRRTWRALHEKGNEKFWSLFGEVF